MLELSRVVNCQRLIDCNKRLWKAFVHFLGLVYLNNFSFNDPREIIFLQ